MFTNVKVDGKLSESDLHTAWLGAVNNDQLGAPFEWRCTRVTDFMANDKGPRGNFARGKKGPFPDLDQSWRS